MINLSLSALGNVIEKLAEKSAKPKKNIVIPYRDSKLTRLLQNALGGSSKTIMICAISPGSSNYEETLSTLRYADRAKKIKNKATVNENPEAKLARELREENAKLKAMLETVGPEGRPTEAMREQQEQIQSLQEALAQSQRSFKEKLVETQQSFREERQRRTVRSVCHVLPMIMNLNEDIQLTGRLKFEFPELTPVRIGGLRPLPDTDDDSSGDGGTSESDESDDEEPEILLKAPGVHTKHAKIVNSCGQCYLISAGPLGARNTWINGGCVAILQEQQRRRRRSLGLVNGETPWAAVSKGELLKVAHRSSAESFGGLESLGSGKGIALTHGDRIAFGWALFLFVDPTVSGAIPEMMIITSGQETYTKALRELPISWRHKRLSGEFPNALSGEVDSSGDDALVRAMSFPRKSVGEVAAEMARLYNELAASASALTEARQERDALAEANRAKDEELRQLREKMRAAEAGAPAQARLPAFGLPSFGRGHSDAGALSKELERLVAGGFGDAIAALDAVASRLTPSAPRGVRRRSSVTLRTEPL